MNTILGIVENIGATFMAWLAALGRFGLFVMKAASRIFLPPYFPREFFRAFFQIGFLSLPVVGLTAMFTGGALALQFYSGGSIFVTETVLSYGVALGVVRELGPVLGGLIVAGRVSSSIAAEIGTMRVSEQLNALKTLSTDPYRYLIAPRLLAATLSMPLLVAVGDVLGIFGGFLVSTRRFGFDEYSYILNSFQFITLMDYTAGVVKAAVFGFILALMGCYHGYYTRGGARGVGRSTTHAVVTTSVLILAFNYILTELFFTV